MNGTHQAIQADAVHSWRVDAPLEDSAPLSEGASVGSILLAMMLAMIAAVVALLLGLSIWLSLLIYAVTGAICALGIAICAAERTDLEVTGESG